MDLLRRADAPETISDLRPQAPAFFSRSGVTVAALVLLASASALLRSEGLRVRLWLDEAISVGIASHPLREIPTLLERDGSPPLYYVILHGWMKLFGNGEVALHSLSLLFATALIPIAYWAGRSLFGRGEGWIAAALAATNPYLGVYSVETRMYTLLALLSLVSVTCFIHCFIFGRRKWLLLFVGALSLALYTHNWGLFLAFALGVTALLWLVRAQQPRREMVWVAGSFAAVGLLYLPWLPTLLVQARHVGAPWSSPPVVREAISSVSAVLGDERVLVALLLTGASLLIDRHLRPRFDEWVVPLALGVTAGVTVAAAWLAAQVTQAWTIRYFGVFLPPLLLLTSWVFRRARAQGILALALVLLFSVHPLGRLTGLRPPPKPYDKSNVWSVSQRLVPMLRPGDLVVSMQIEMIPLLVYYLNPSGGPIDYATPEGLVREPEVVDWRDATARMNSARAESGLIPLMNRLSPGNRLVLTCPTSSMLRSPLPWFQIMRNHCAEWQTALSSAPGFRLVHGPDPGPEVRPRGASIVARVYEKVDTGPAPQSA